MLRICLIIAIIAGLAGGGVSVVKVREKMLETMNQRDQEKSEKEKTQAELGVTKKDLAGTKDKLKTTEGKLTSTENELKTVTAKADELDKQKTELIAKLQQTQTDRDTAQQELMKWELTTLKPEQIKPMIAEKARLISERDTVIKENKIMNQKNHELQAKIDYYFGGNLRPPALPAGLKGKVLAVDPKFQFVVLDIGGDQGVLTRGEMLVNRNGKLIGKIAIASVDKSRSIANILPSWQHGDLLEGDQVITISDN